MTNQPLRPGRRPRDPTVALGVVALGLVAAVMVLGPGINPTDRLDATAGRPSVAGGSQGVGHASIAITAPHGLRDRTWDADPSSVPTSMGTPGPAVRDSPAPAPRPASRPFAINLFTKGDFVAQARSDWCVPASILSMINMIDAPHARRPPSQRELDRMARRFSSPRLRGAGSEPEGWARTLNRLGYGPYEVRAERTRAAAIATAARAIRLTGRPVGLLVWRGAHAWVVSGFRATADPAETDDFVVTHLSVLDPWYPRHSSVWGPSQRPNATLRMREIAADYLAWHRPTVRYTEKDGRFVLVIPVEDATAPRTNPSD